MVAEGFHHGIGDHVGRFIGIFLRSRSTVVVASAKFLTTLFFLLLTEDVDIGEGVIE